MSELINEVVPQKADEVKPLKKRLSDAALQPMNENTPVEPKQRYRIAHNFPEKDGYFRRGRAGDMELSIAMFVKDEGETIYEVLHSVVSVAKEYVIGIDSKTSDNTREEIEKFMKNYDKLEYNIYDFEWQDDFATARNTAVEKCKYPWIMILDGHDVFDTDCTPTLIDAMGTLSDDVWLVEFYVYMNPDEDNIPQTFFPQPRLLRNREEVRYKSKVHNYIRIPLIHKVIMPEIIIHHKRTLEKGKIRSEQRKQMGIKHFHEEIDENPNDTRALFYLGNMTLEDSQDFQRATEYYQRYLTIESSKQFIDERSQVYINLCACYKILNEPEKMLKVASNGIAEGIQRRELWMILGDYYFSKKRYKEAITYYIMATKLPMPLCQLFLSGPIYTYAPWQSLAQCYLALENFQKARDCFIHMLEFKPKNKDIVNNIRSCERKMGIKEKVRAGGINISFFDSTRSFIDPICEKLGTKHNVRLSKQFEPLVARMSDLIFVEWGDKNAILATEQDLGTPIILRIHRYELFTKGFQHINFENINAVIFVAEHVKKMALDLYPELLQPLEDLNRIHVIPNNIDVDLWPMIEDHSNKDILFLGSIRHMKNFQLAFELAIKYPYLNFHHIGRLDDNSEIKPFYDHRLLKVKNLKMYGHVNRTELNQLIEKIKPGFVVNTSMIEGHPVGIMEMMCKGICPIVYDYPGAASALKLNDEHVFESIDHFEPIYLGLCDKYLDRESRKELRLHIRKNFSSVVVLPQIYNLCMSVYDDWDVNIRERIKNHPLKHAFDLADFEEVKPDEDSGITI